MREQQVALERCGRDNRELLTRWIPRFKDEAKTKLSLPRLDAALANVVSDFLTDLELFAPQFEDAENLPLEVGNHYNNNQKQ